MLLSVALSEVFTEKLVFIESQLRGERPEAVGENSMNSHVLRFVCIARIGIIE